MADMKLWIVVISIFLLPELDARIPHDLFYSRIRSMLDQLSRRHDKRLPHLLAVPKPTELSGWPGNNLSTLGQVSGVAVDPQGNPVIFHRGPRVWDESSFNITNHFQHVKDGPIPVDTVITLHKNTGVVLSSWGKDMFYMPHGICVCPEGNIWLTDVALHQVFKFKPGDVEPSVVLGQRFEPGSGRHHLCQPTSVAVASTGEVFVADGYCNSRILVFDSQGYLLRGLPQPREFLSLRVPHSLALLERLDMICIADRENMRVVCPRAGLEGYQVRGSPAPTIQGPDLGRVYGVAAWGNYVYAVNGPTSPSIPVRGFTLDPLAETIVDYWNPIPPLVNPHDIAVSPNGTEMYITEIGPNRVRKFDLRPYHVK